MTYLKVLVFVCFSVGWLNAQDCEVKIPELEGTYEGKCKRGSAHGKGMAKGVDTYEGNFKKGFPDGEGTYTFQNGNVYKGSFDKGKKEGEGVMTFADNKLPTLDGFWIDDEYAGKDKKVYDLIDRSTSIKNVKFRRIDGSENMITFKFTNQGKPVKSKNVVFDCPLATEIRQNDFEANYSVSSYPLKGNIRFSAAALKNANGSSDFVSGQAEIEIRFKGNWEVTVEMNSN